MFKRKSVFVAIRCALVSQASFIYNYCRNMADNGSIVFPDDVERVKRECQWKNTNTNTNNGNSGMADNDRIVFPDDVEDTKEKVVQESEEVNTNTVEQPPELGSANMRNMIVTPGNCPPGQTRGADGICRDVF